jgi:phytoene/squalene synthetase
MSDPLVDSPALVDAEGALDWCEQFVEANVGRDPLVAALRVRTLRRPLAAIYAFARTADDLARAPGEPVAARRRSLDALEDRLERAWHGEAQHPLFVALDRVSRDHALPITPFRDLVAGMRAEIDFVQPITFASAVRRYESSVGPIARILLLVAGGDPTGPVQLAERFAVGLRLLDDLVDLESDLARGRATIPAEDLAAFGLALEDLRASERDPAVLEMIAFAAARARAFVLLGRPLRRMAPEPLRPLVDALLRIGLRAAERLEAGT